MEQNTNHGANDNYSNKNNIGNKLKIEIINNSIPRRWRRGGGSQEHFFPIYPSVTQSHSRTGLSSNRAEVALQYR